MQRGAQPTSLADVDLHSWSLDNVTLGPSRTMVKDSDPLFRLHNRYVVTATSIIVSRSY